ncbi:C40 family peptidase [Isoptericola sp. b408]|uniref:C40 family peptidase n=1 Tax=Isoptericola sp. b408 TaxID=3064653 RepID=UPI0027142761|nr:C40 family peptidase [Isoptericola sp. b408]MDO8150340.1 C40 family peptidase [Isoptericola sp. b408]
MSTPSLDAARPQGAVRTPRKRHAAVAMTLTAALAGGTLVAGAGSAAADDALTTTTDETVAGDTTSAGTTTTDATDTSVSDGTATPTPEPVVEDTASPEPTTTTDGTTTTPTEEPAAEDTGTATEEPVVVSTTPDVSVSKSRSTGRKGQGHTRPRYTVRATADGEAFAGRVRLYVQGTKVAVKSLDGDGTIHFRPGFSHYDVGRNGIRVVVAPAASTGLEQVTKHRRVWIKPKATTNMYVSKSRHTATKGKWHTRPKYTVKLRKWGEPVQGRVRLFISGDKVAVKKTNKYGVVRFRPGLGKYDLGKNRIRVVGVPARAEGLKKSTKYRKVHVKPKMTRGQKVVRVAHNYIGHRYSWGGTSPATGFDCSGFTSYVYKKAIGKTLPRSSSAQASLGTRVSRSNARQGDLVYSPGHIGIYAGNGRIIESARPGVGVVKRQIWQSSPRFIRI